MIPVSSPDLRRILDRVETESTASSITIRITKTKVVNVSKTLQHLETMNIKLNSTKLEQVNTFKYVGTIMNEKWDSEQEIKGRIELARSIFMKCKIYFAMGN